ncbi:MAG TPA: hypothetical protein VHI13_16245 [Candidatus Kapabacteria bacterium]|nr:hypothetical protein [Candidatus Kapabacteria bacterium]
MSMTPNELLSRYIECHNEGVETSNFSPLVELFSHDAEIKFIIMQPRLYRGRDAIAAAFAEHPPTDQLRAHHITPVATGATTLYEWSQQPGVQAGSIHARIECDLIQRMVIHVWPEPPDTRPGRSMGPDGSSTPAWSSVPDFW